MVCKINQLSTLLFLTFTLAIISSQGILAIEYVVKNTAAKTEGGMVFAKQIGEHHARRIMKKATKFFWQILEENTKVDRKSYDVVFLTMVDAIEPSHVEAETDGNHIKYATEFINVTEFDGIMYHEMTHVWQWDGNATAEVNLIEGIAEYVKMKALGIRFKMGSGLGWDDGDEYTAAFLVYCESLRKGFVAELNKKMRFSYSVKYFDELLGTSVDQLWSDYKAKYGGH